MLDSRFTAPVTDGIADIYEAHVGALWGLGFRVSGLGFRAFRGSYEEHVGAIK